MSHMENPEILELLESWTDEELKERIIELQAALDLRNEWNEMNRNQKDKAWDAAGVSEEDIEKLLF